MGVRRVLGSDSREGLLAPMSTRERQGEESSWTVDVRGATRRSASFPRTTTRHQQQFPGQGNLGPVAHSGPRIS